MSTFLENLFNKRNKIPTIQAGITYGADDLINDNSLTNDEKRQILQNNLISENQRLDNELKKDLINSKFYSALLGVLGFNSMLNQSRFQQELLQR